MFDIFKIGRINRISRTHSEKISDRLILYNTVNLKDARDTLTPDEYQRFYGVFKKICKRKKEVMTNLFEYENRAFAIAYEIEWDAEVSYDKVCGDATDILFMYSAKKRQFDDIIREILDKYKEIIDSIIERNGSDFLKVMAMSISYFQNLLLVVYYANHKKQDDLFMDFVIEMAFKIYTVDVE